jgi:hypothetical protein
MENKPDPTKGVAQVRSAATHFLEYDQRTREYRPVPIPMYARD